MVGDYWVSDKTGRIYEVGPRGTRWPVVGHVDDLGGVGGLAAVLGYFGAALGLGLSAAVLGAAFMGLALGAVVAFFPAALPFSVPLLFLLLVATSVRALLTRRAVTPVLRAGIAFVAVLVVAVLDVIYWRNGDEGLYLTVASLPIMPVVTLGFAVWAGFRRRWALAALLLAQATVFASTYLGSVGSATYQGSSTGMDNLLSLTYWVCLTCVLAAWLTPRRGDLSEMQDQDRRITR